MKHPVDGNIRNIYRYRYFLRVGKNLLVIFAYSWSRDDCCTSRLVGSEGLRAVRRCRRDINALTRWQLWSAVTTFTTVHSANHQSCTENGEITSRIPRIQSPRPSHLTQLPFDNRSVSKDSSLWQLLAAAAAAAPVFDRCDGRAPGGKEIEGLRFCPRIIGLLPYYCLKTPQAS